MYVTPKSLRVRYSLPSSLLFYLTPSPSPFFFLLLPPCLFNYNDGQTVKGYYYRGYAYGVPRSVGRSACRPPRIYEREAALQKTLDRPTATALFAASGLPNEEHIGDAMPQHSLLHCWLFSSENSLCLVSLGCIKQVVLCRNVVAGRQSYDLMSLLYAMLLPSEHAICLCQT